MGIEFCPLCGNAVVEKETHFACGSKRCSYRRRKEKTEPAASRSACVNERNDLKSLTIDGVPILRDFK